MPVLSYTPPPGTEEAAVSTPDPAAAAIVGAELPGPGSDEAAASAGALGEDIAVQVPLSGKHETGSARARSYAKHVDLQARPSSSTDAGSGPRAACTRTTSPCLPNHPRSPSTPPPPHPPSHRPSRSRPHTPPPPHPGPSHHPSPSASPRSTGSTRPSPSRTPRSRTSSGTPAGCATCIAA